MEILIIFFIVAMVYLVSSLMIGIITYCRISCHILHRHHGILTGKTIVRIFAFMESLSSAIKLSPKWITMKSDDIEYKLDEKFCPTYLI